MKFEHDRPYPTAIRSYGPDWIELSGAGRRGSGHEASVQGLSKTGAASALAGRRCSSSIILTPEGAQPWAVDSFDALRCSHFEDLVQFGPELIVFGSGQLHRFVHPSVLLALTQAGIGVETMSTPAACRTWNILLSEGRQAIAALLIEPKK